jgi:hypothetical protein
VGQAEAGLIFVSADANIAFGVDGSFGTPTPNDNGVFFRNVLPGGTGVVKLYSGDFFGGVQPAATSLDGFYNAQAGVSSSIGTGPITAGDVAGADLLYIVLPDTALTAAETAVVKDFVYAGHTVFFIGENAVFAGNNLAVNSDLAALGSSLQIFDTPVLDSGFHHATPGNGQVLVDPFTTGVSDLVYAGPNGVTGGTSPFLETDLSTAFVAYQSLGAVPEPPSLSLGGMAAAVLSLMALRRAHRSQDSA